jgi:ribosomal protein S18 acetylase RimI-like enzyme
MLQKVKNNYIIRHYIESDYDKVIELWKSLDLGKPERGDNNLVIKKTLVNGGVLYILEKKLNSELIGTSWITNDQRRLYLHHFGIKKEYQGNGLSKLLLDKSLRFARKSNLQIKLEVHVSNRRALELYKKYGFSYLGDYEVYIIRKYD